MTDSCCKLFKLKCFRKLSTSSSTNAAAAVVSTSICENMNEKHFTSTSLPNQTNLMKNQSSLSFSGGSEIVDKKNNVQTISSTSIDKEKKVVHDDETQVLLRRHQHAYLLRSVSETTSNGDAIMWTSDDEFTTDEDETHDILAPLVDEINRNSTDDEQQRNKSKLREFPQMKSRLEMNLFEKLFREKFKRKVIYKS
jgi:hypothetical protein